jgi:hypothetical protein
MAHYLRAVFCETGSVRIDNKPTPAREGPHMKIRKQAVSVVAILTLAGTAALSARAFQGSGYQIQPINAEYVPTQEEVKTELTDLRTRLDYAQKSSFYSAEASSDYLDAERYYKFGRYDEALEDARDAEKALPTIPNWVTPATASR